METVDYTSVMTVNQEKYANEIVCDEYLIGGEVRKWTGKFRLCVPSSHLGKLETVYSPIYSSKGEKVHYKISLL